MTWEEIAYFIDHAMTKQERKKDAVVWNASLTDSSGGGFMSVKDIEAKERVLDAVKNEDIVLTADDYVMDSGEIAYCCKADSYDLEDFPTLESFTD